MNKISIILIGIVLLAVVLTSCVPEGEYNLLLEKKEVLDKKIMELKLTIKTYQDTYGMVYSGIQPPYRGLSSPILLMNKESSKNPTWAQLLEFLEKDKTEEGIYGGIRKDYNSTLGIGSLKIIGGRYGGVLGEGVCGDFAQRLHNNAESNGLKAAFVVAHLYEGDPHAFNAFKTTDKGLVFVDCTGLEADFSASVGIPDGYGGFKQPPPPPVKDRILFVVKEKELGVVSLRSNLQLDYSSYLDMKLEQDLYSKEVERHNSEVERHNSEVERMMYIQDYSAYRKITEWNKTLEAKEEGLYTILSQLNTVWPSLGVVKEIKIYW